MNKYTEMSDLEINKRVFVAAKIEHEDTDLHSNKVFYGDGANWIEFNPCNNPSDAMPIINEYGISLIYQDRKFQFATNDGNIECCITNPLKAAMIIFLCVKDAENEKV
ncbi:phage protein NinX family protein [Proteus mirabilis]|uniref:phage protein NinX family protein n=1 Tax=Proteus mirabilis TaxID=584 RepID=UPI003D26D64A